MSKTNFNRTCSLTKCRKSNATWYSFLSKKYICEDCAKDYLERQHLLGAESLGHDVVINIACTTTYGFLGTLYVETDWDFSVKHNNKIYGDMEFSLQIDSVANLKDLTILGPHGSTIVGHRYEIDRALEVILKDPTEEYSNLGGNRGVSWSPSMQLKAQA
jgi:hypothetical protein